MEYTKLTLGEKQVVTHLLNTKKALEKAKQAHEKAIQQALAMAKEYGTIAKGVEKIVYSPDGEYITLDTTRLKAEKPELLNEYGKTVARKASVKVLVK